MSLLFSYPLIAGVNSDITHSGTETERMDVMALVNAYNIPAHYISNLNNCNISGKCSIT